MRTNMATTRPFTLVATLLLVTHLDGVSAQHYGMGYGYHFGWRHVYIMAIVLREHAGALTSIFH